jgi:hypothetical protein
MTPLPLKSCCIRTVLKKDLPSSMIAYVICRTISGVNLERSCWTSGRSIIAWIL